MERAINVVFLASAIAGIAGAILAWGFATDDQRHQFLTFCWLTTCERAAAPAPSELQSAPPPARSATLEPMVRASAPATPGNAAAPTSASEVCRQFTSTTYCVSSMLAPQGSNSYGPENLFDSDPDTAWVPDTQKAVDGLGEWILLRFARPRSVAAVVVANGYQKSQRDIYFKNDRPRDIEILLSNGRTQSVVLDDRFGVQRIDLSGADSIDWIQVRIRSVYPGTKYHDVGISDIGAL